MESRWSMSHAELYENFDAFEVKKYHNTLTGRFLEHAVVCIDKRLKCFQVTHNDVLVLNCSFADIVSIIRGSASGLLCLWLQHSAGNDSLQYQIVLDIKPKKAAHSFGRLVQQDRGLDPVATVYSSRSRKELIFHDLKTHLKGRKGPNLMPVNPAGVTMGNSGQDTDEDIPNHPPTEDVEPAGSDSDGDESMSVALTPGRNTPSLRLYLASSDIDHAVPESSKLDNRSCQQPFIAPKHLDRNDSELSISNTLDDIQRQLATLTSALDLRRTQTAGAEQVKAQNGRLQKQLWAAGARQRNPTRDKKRQWKARRLLQRQLDAVKSERESAQQRDDELRIENAVLKADVKVKEKQVEDLEADAADRKKELERAKFDTGALTELVSMTLPVVNVPKYLDEARAGQSVRAAFNESIGR